LTRKADSAKPEQTSTKALKHAAATASTTFANESSLAVPYLI
jgi:hypothetical protein